MISCVVIDYPHHIIQRGQSRQVVFASTEIGVDPANPGNSVDTILEPIGLQQIASPLRVLTTPRGPRYAAAR